MKLRELLNLMNIADVAVNSKDGIITGGDQPIDMFRLDRDPLVQKFGNYEVEQITNVCKLQLTVWIKDFENDEPEYEEQIMIDTEVADE